MVLQQNLDGPGAAQAAVWHELGLPITLILQMHWNTMDKKLHDAQKRQSSKEAHAHTLELNKQSSKLWQEEHTASKARHDEYHSGPNKTALNAPQSTPPTPA